jgi:hypothetical protein
MMRGECEAFSARYDVFSRTFLLFAFANSDTTARTLGRVAVLLPHWRQFSHNRCTRPSKNHAASIIDYTISRSVRYCHILIRTAI